MENIKILQFGEGNFLRGFADDIFHHANDEGVFSGSVAVIKPRGDQPLTLFKQQKNVYTVCIRGAVCEDRRNTVISHAINPNLEPKTYRELYLSEQLRFVISNTTEMGIVCDETDDFHAPVPRTFPCRVTKLLYERFVHFNGDPQKGIYFLPCELIDSNGDRLKECVLHLARYWSLPQLFISWVENSCYFLNTLVDRIVSGFPKDPSEHFSRIGWEDRLLTVCEPFYLWVIEDQGNIRQELPLDKACPGVVFAEDVKPYKERKVRLLNGAHTALLPLSALSGLEYVAQTMDEPGLAAFLDMLYEQELIPAFNGLSSGLLWQFAEDVKQRFRNPYLFHRWEAISLNSFSKFHARLLTSIGDYRARFGTLPQRIMLCFAALVELYCCREIADSLEIMGFFAAHREDKPEQLVHELLILLSFGADADDQFEQAAVFWLKALRRLGIGKCMEAFSAVIQLHSSDHVAVAKWDISAGDPLCINGELLTAKNHIAAGHKVAACMVEKGSPVYKYGFAIGVAQQRIEAGEHVHSHNLHSALTGTERAEYIHSSGNPIRIAPAVFRGYLRANGKVGIRNEIWIIPTVGCINRTAERMAELANKKCPKGVDGVVALTHPYGCSQLGEDHDNTKKLLAALAGHPNAGGVLLLGLGCENNQLQQMLPMVDQQNLKTLICQEQTDELAAGMELLERLMQQASVAKRQEFTADKLIVGLKCGGSDGLSGISANAVVGRCADILCAMGGSVVMGEVPEMFGAEQALLGRCDAQQVFAAADQMIASFKQSYMNRGFPICENPSPGNRAGGITTLEEKSLGCVQKCGRSPVTDVLDYGQLHRKKGVTLICTPGNDMVATTALAAAGCQLVLFTTGRGTPYGTCVPTLKISSNSKLAKMKAKWIDFDAGNVLQDKTLDVSSQELLKLIMEIGSGKYAKNEEYGFKEIAVWKDGVTL